MRRFLLPVLLTLAALTPLPAGAATPSQISWVRSAASRFLAAELAHNGAGVCAILDAPMRKSYRDRSCEQRWDATLTRLLRSKAARTELHSDSRAVATAAVVVEGKHATIALPHPLLGGTSRFLWSESCWMLQG
jgi:hypothetical protein